MYSNIDLQVAASKDQRPDEFFFNQEKKDETEEVKERREERQALARYPEDFDWNLIELRERPKGPITLYPFMLDMVGPDFTIAFIGKRREGKSFALRWVAKKQAPVFPRVFVFTRTKFNYYWQQYVPSKRIFNGFSAAILMQIIERQKLLVEWMFNHPDEADKINPRILIILDDVISKDLRYEEELRVIFYEGRHSKISLYITMQYAYGIPPGMRENLDMAFIFRLHSTRQIEAVADTFLAQMPKKTAKWLLEAACWKDDGSDQRQCLVVDTSNNAPPDQMLLLAQPQPVEDDSFVLGAKEWWGDEKPYRPPKKK